MSEEAFSVTWWACSAYAAVTPAVGISNRCCPLLNLNPTYCQISSTLHISLSELEQVALNFTSPPHLWSTAIGSTWRGLAALRPPTPTAIAGASPALRPPRHCRHFGRHAIAGTSAVLAAISVATPSQALRPSSQAFRSPRHRRHFGRPRRHFGRHQPPSSHRRRFGSHRRRHIAGASPATAGTSHHRRAPCQWL